MTGDNKRLKHCREVFLSVVMERPSGYLCNQTECSLTVRLWSQQKRHWIWKTTVVPFVLTQNPRERFLWQLSSVVTHFWLFWLLDPVSFLTPSGVTTLRLWVWPTAIFALFQPNRKHSGCGLVRWSTQVDLPSGLPVDKLLHILVFATVRTFLGAYSLERETHSDTVGLRWRVGFGKVILRVGWVYTAGRFVHGTLWSLVRVWPRTRSSNEGKAHVETDAPHPHTRIRPLLQTTNLSSCHSIMKTQPNLRSANLTRGGNF